MYELRRLGFKQLQPGLALTAHDPSSSAETFPIGEARRNSGKDVFDRTCPALRQESQMSNSSGSPLASPLQLLGLGFGAL